MNKLTRYRKNQYKGEFNLKQMEKEHILKVYKMLRGNKRLLAAVLGISERNLYDKIYRHNIENEMKCEFQRIFNN